MTKVLHIAPENTAGVPYEMMRMQNMFRMHARLITFYRNQYNIPEDICLDLPLPRSRLAMKYREVKQSLLHKRIKQERKDSLTVMPVFRPANKLEQAYMQRREKKNQGALLKALREVNADSFEVFHFDGGMDFYGDSRLAKKWKQTGKKIVNCYFGDDLRTRGIVREMDELSDLNLTFEYDHTLRHPDINFLFFPYDISKIKYIDDKKYFAGIDKKKLRLVHAPTRRFIKGTEFVLNALKKVKASGRDFDFVLVENETREKTVEIKSTCHIAIDQIGNRGGTGYGLNSVETLAMGLPTITDMNGGMDKWLPENPFVVADSENLAEKIIDLIDNFESVSKNRIKLRQWVEKNHSYESVFNRLTEYYKEHKII